MREFVEIAGNAAEIAGVMLIIGGLVLASVIACTVDYGRDAA